jgi:ribosomal protein S18 acetylase RimI-like enzyme
VAPGIDVRRYVPATDLAWAEALLDAEFAGRMQARRGELMDPLEREGLVAELDGRPLGLLTWVVGGSFSRADEAEIRVLVVAHEARNRGVGSALLGEAERALAQAGLDRAWMVTTNDNLDALGFYQRRGWRLAELHPGAVDEARRHLKPAIGRVGANGIPIHDEIVVTVGLRADG